MIRDHVSAPGIGSSYLDIDVKNPRTHIDRGKALYTDYEIEVKTNHPSFPLLYSKTRRRYSEFVWLRNQLGFNDIMMHFPQLFFHGRVLSYHRTLQIINAAPRLPGKQLIGRFKESFLQERSEGLERFLKRITAENSYLQEPSLQLFLQTNLSTSEMEHYIKTRTTGAIKSLIVKLHTKGLKKRERKISTKQPSNEYPLTKKNLRRQSGGRGWSSQYGDGYYTLPFGYNDETDFLERDVHQRSSTFNAGVLPGGRLTLPTIPGSIDGGLPCSGSELTTTTDEEDDVDLQPLSASWHGSQHDHVDFILDDYEIIPMDIISQIEDENQAEISDLGYLDLTTTTEHLTSYSNEQACFDY